MNSRRIPVARIVALACAFAIAVTLPAPTAGASIPMATHPLSGTESAAGHTVTWTIDGAFPVPADRPDLLAYPYDGVIYPGSTVTLNGSESCTRVAGPATNPETTASSGSAGA